MTLQANSVLKTVRSNLGNCGAAFCFYKDQIIDLSNGKRFPCQKNPEQLGSIFKLLVSEGYFDQTGPNTYYLSQKGIHTSQVRFFSFTTRFWNGFIAGALTGAASIVLAEKILLWLSTTGTP
mgnify:CR=1 FL=1